MRAHEGGGRAERARETGLLRTALQAPQQPIPQAWRLRSFLIPQPTKGLHLLSCFHSQRLSFTQPARPAQTAWYCLHSHSQQTQHRSPSSFYLCNSLLQTHHIIAIWPPPLSLPSFSPLLFVAPPEPPTQLFPSPTLRSFFRRPAPRRRAAKRLRLRSHVPSTDTQPYPFLLFSLAQNTPPCVPLSSLPPCSLSRLTPSVSTPFRMR